MKTLQINNKVVKIYDSIDEMPIVNFQKYNRYLLIDSGIGSDVDDVDAHIVRIAKLINSEDKKKAIQELQSMRQNLHMINSQISPKYLAFAALIHSIDGKEITDLSDDNLKAILENLKTVKHSALVELILKLKKKVNTELETYFPGDFVSPREKEAYDKVKHRTILVLESMLSGIDNSEQIERIDTALFASYTPKNFTGPESVEVQYNKQFESACLLISRKTNLDAKKMTVLQFYKAVEDLKKEAEAQAKKNKHSNRK